MNAERHDHPRRPILTAFMSYSIDDRAAVVPLIEALRAARVDVLDFLEDEPPGVDVHAWVEGQIAEADCILVVVSEQALTRPRWIEREIGLALHLLTDNGVLDPTIVPIRLEAGAAGASVVRPDEAVQFQPRNFHTEVPFGPPIEWRNVNSLRLGQDGVAKTVEAFLKWLTPQTILITDPEAVDQARLFDGSMRLYRELLPDERERVPEAGLIDALCQSWRPDGQVDAGSPYLSVLAVHHIGGKVIGLLSCDVERASGIGFVNFWGLRAAHRSHGRGVAFAQDVIGRLRTAEPKLRALLFAAETVEWGVLDRFLKQADKVWAAAKKGGPPRPDDYHRLADPLDGGPSAIARALAAAPRPRRAVIIEQLRRFRRFALYTNGANYNKAFERQGIEILAFMCCGPAAAGSGGKPNRCKHPWGPMADFAQPPIRPPINDGNSLHLWLFALLFDGRTLSAAEAVDWIYDVYFADFLGRGKFALPGWNEYMVGFRRRWRDVFVADAELRRLRLRDWFAPYNLLLTEVKKYWVHQQALGDTDGRWDIQL